MQLRVLSACVSAAHSDSTSCCMCRGTTPYAAPEQLAGVVTKACDIWAFGRVALELLGVPNPLVWEQHHIIKGWAKVGALPTQLSC